MHSVDSSCEFTLPGFDTQQRLRPRKILAFMDLGGVLMYITIMKNWRVASSIVQQSWNQADPNLNQNPGLDRATLWTLRELFNLFKAQFPHI